MTEEIKPIELETKPEEAPVEFAGIDIDKEVKEETAGPVDPMADLPEEVRKKLEKKTVAPTTKKNKLRGKKKKKGERRVTVGKAFIHSSYNNTIVTITDLDGNAIAWSSAGIAGFKGPKKSTPYAASIITKIAVLKAKEFGLTEVSVFVKGVGTGRESAIRALNANGLEITFIKDITPIPHNGCRRKKPRRV
jgi:small subunit ribosomal protein S11